MQQSIRAGIFHPRAELIWVPVVTHLRAVQRGGSSVFGRDGEKDKSQRNKAQPSFHKHQQGDKALAEKKHSNSTCDVSPEGFFPNPTSRHKKNKNNKCKQF